MSNLQSIVFPVHNLEAAKLLYGELLGVEPHTDQPYYVGFRVGELEVALDPNGHSQGMTGPVGFWAVTDLDEAIRTLVDSGATLAQQPRDVGEGRIATLTDSDGNTFGLIG